MPLFLHFITARVRSTKEGSVFSLSVHRGEEVTSLWSQVLSGGGDERKEGKGGVPQSGPRSGVPPPPPCPFPPARSTPVRSQVRDACPAPPQPGPREWYPIPPGQDQDWGHPSPPPSPRDSTCYGQDTPRAVHLLRSRRKTFLSKQTFGFYFFDIFF